MELPKYKDVVIAHERIRSYIHRTPMLTSESINNILGCELFFKCENFQKVGAFKFRGACNAVFRPRFKELVYGVATHSSGNHAAALALAAKIRGVRAQIVMPENAPQIKIDAVKGYGGEITFCKPTNEEREKELKKIIERTGALEIHPYNNFNVIAGQGTCVKELLEEQCSLDVIIAPVGGGGLLSGTCLGAHGINPNIKVYAGEPLGAADAKLSLKTGRIEPSLEPKTMADGLLTSLGTLTFEIIKKHITEIITVDESSILKAMQLVWERMKIVIEPSAAVSLAVVMENKEMFKGKRVGLIFTGGNVSFQMISKFIEKEI